MIKSLKWELLSNLLELSVIIHYIFLAFSQAKNQYNATPATILFSFSLGFS